MKETPNLPAISDAQREIMNIVWDQGEVGVAEVWRMLSARRPVARNTILTLITRLVDKGWLRTRRVGNAFRYTAAWPREQAQADEIRRLVDMVFDGSAEGMVMTLLQGGSLSPAESERIRAMILKALRLPSKCSKEAEFRNGKIQEALQQAIEVPYRTALDSFEAMQTAHEIAVHGPASTQTDAVAGVEIAYAAVLISLRNISTNLEHCKDAEYVNRMRQQCATLREIAQKLREESEEFLENSGISAG